MWSINKKEQSHQELYSAHVPSGLPGNTNRSEQNHHAYRPGGIALLAHASCCIRPRLTSRHKRRTIVNAMGTVCSKTFNATYSHLYVQQCACSSGPSGQMISCSEGIGVASRRCGSACALQARPTVKTSKGTVCRRCSSNRTRTAFHRCASGSVLSSATILCTSCRNQPNCRCESSSPHAADGHALLVGHRWR